MKFGTNVAFIFLIYATAGHVGAAAGIINDRQLQFSDNHNIAIASRISRSERRTQNLPSPLSLPSINILRGGGAINAPTLSDTSNNIDHVSEQRNMLKSRTLNALHLTSFLAVASVAMVMTWVRYGGGNGWAISGSQVSPKSDDRLSWMTRSALRRPGTREQRR